ncbi:MAG: zinc-ribbon domain-containing protein [Bacillota bacterium]
MAFCGQCGAKIDDGARFCPSCGAVQSSEGAVQPEAAPQQTWQPTPQAAPQQDTGYQQAQQGYQQGGYQQYQQQYQQPQPERTYEPDGDPRTLGIGAITMFSYSGLLFLLPLLICKNSRFARYHASQGLNLLLAGVAYCIASAILTAIGFAISLGFGAILSTLVGIAGLALPVLAIFGIVHVCKGETKPLPVIGGIQIIKM